MTIKIALTDIGDTLLDIEENLIRPNVFQKMIALTQNGHDIIMATDGGPYYADKIEKKLQNDQKNNPDKINIFKRKISRLNTNWPQKSNYGWWQDNLALLQHRQYQGQDIKLLLLDDRSDIRRMAEQFNVTTIDTSKDVTEGTIIAQLDAFFMAP